MAQATAGVLSQNIPTWECCSGIGLMSSSTSHPSKTPAISKSEIEIVPFLLLEETKRALIASGHCMRHTVALISLVPLIHTPPTPYLEASTYPMNHGNAAISSKTEVGLVDIRCIKVTQSKSACLTAGVILITSVVLLSVLLSGDRRPRPVGSPMQA